MARLLLANPGASHGETAGEDHHRDDGVPVRGCLRGNHKHHHESGQCHAHQGHAQPEQGRGSGQLCCQHCSQGCEWLFNVQQKEFVMLGYNANFQISDTLFGTQNEERNSPILNFILLNGPFTTLNLNHFCFEMVH